jgi:hypothetical protein
MPEKRTKPNSKSKSNSRRTSLSDRKYEVETVALQSLRLIAAPNPKDDLSDEEIAQIVKRSAHSSELINHLIDYIKTL